MGLPEKGIVTTVNWMMGNDGDRYMYWFSSHWRIVTDSQVPILNFHSRERWSLLAYKNDPLHEGVATTMFPTLNEVVAMFPGCQISGFIKSDCPTKTIGLAHKTDEPENLPGVFNLDEGVGIH